MFDTGKRKNRVSVSRNLLKDAQSWSTILYENLLEFASPLRN
jgi:hypothetical protein